MKLFGNKRNAARVRSSKSSSPAAPKRKTSHRLSGVQRGCLLMAASFLVLGLTVFAVYKDFVKPVDLNQNTQRTEVSIPKEEQFVPPTKTEVEVKVDKETGQVVRTEVEVPVGQKAGFYNILIAGIDEDGIRTDTIMIGRVNTVDHTAALLSVPRDTLIDADFNVPKINAVYGVAGGGEKGMQSLKNQLAKLLGFAVNGYALVDLDAFVELVDLVGGVEFHVPQRMFYNDPSQDLYIDLQEGLQTLDGEQAMGLVRYRKGYASQDIMRTQVQQDFMRALAKKCLSLSNLKKIGELSDLFAKYVMMDLSVGNIAYFGQELLKCDFENMFTYTLEGDTVTIDGISYWALYQNKTLRIINEYFNPYETDLTVDDMQILSPERVLARYGDSVVVEKSEGTSDEPAVPEEEDSSSSEPPSDDPFAADPQPGIPTDDPFAADPQPETPPTNSEVWTDGGQTGESYQPTFDDNGFIR